ncbi:MAG: ROK family protein [Humibacillus sp.]|nr:ROK family protein [Humibacillus sp.]MDN5778026.1 ROK family protein [Humibacillus sp.]
MTPSAVIGIDVGGTRIKSAVITPAGTVLDELVLPTPEHIGDSIGTVVADLVGGHLARLADRATEQDPRFGGIEAVGVVVPGVVDDVLGIGRYSSNLGWRDLDLRGLIGREVDLPLAVGHDVRAGLLAEHRFGAAVGADNVVFVPLGTGIASAVLSGGRLLADPRSGEIGHVRACADGPACGCGAHGCLETIASARAIGRRFTERLASAGDPSTLSALPASSAPATAADVAELVEAAAGSGVGGAAGADSRTQAALEVWHEAVEALATVLAPIVMALGTETVLIGGGLVRAGETLLAPLRQAVAQRLGAGLTVEVQAAALGDRAGSLGAGVLALEVLGA